MLKRIVFFLGLLLLLTVVGCGQSDADQANNNDKLLIYTSIYPIQYITESITGEHADVKTIYPPGVDAHSYEPTTKEIMALAQSDSFIYLGAGMESFAETVVETLSSQDILFIEIGADQSLFNESDHADDNEHDHGDVDPHIWLDPLRMVEMTTIIKNELIKLQPEFTDDFEENTTELIEQLVTLDEEFTTLLEAKEQKDIIVAHAAYGYWEERYGINQIPISGLMAGNEPSQKELTDIVTQAKEKELDYVIFEQNGSDRVSKIIQEHIGADALTIHNLGVLTEEDIQQGENYLSLMRTNLSVLDQATN